MTKLKSILYIAYILAVFAACKKEKDEPVNLPSLCDNLFSPSLFSYSTLDLSQTTNPNLFSLSLNPYDDVSGVTYDINCDGIADLAFNAESDQDWIGQTEILYGRLFVTILNNNTFILLDSIIDSTFIALSSDTNGVNILENQLQSSYPIVGSTLQHVNVNYYATHYDSLGVLHANDSRWTSNTQKILDYYRRSESYYFGPDTNGFYHDIESVNEYRRGIIPNLTTSYLPVRYVGANGVVKMGYFKLRPSISFGFASVGLAGWSIQP